MPSAATSWWSCQARCATRSPRSHPVTSPTSPGSEFLLFSTGINPAYRAEDANEDTIGVLVRLITEKKGEGRAWPCGQAQEWMVSCQSLRQPPGSESHVLCPSPRTPGPAWHSLTSAAEGAAPLLFLA